MRTEGFKRGVVSILLVFALVFSMILVSPLASSGDWVNRPEPGGTTIEVVQGDNFLIRHVLEWDEPENGAYTITLHWDCYDNHENENFTFVGASAYFTTGPHEGESILAVAELDSAPSLDYPGSTRHVLKVDCPANNKDNRNGQFNVDIWMGAYGAGGVPHILTDNHPIPYQFGGVIIFEAYPNFWNRDPITIRVLATGLLSHDPIYIDGNAGFTPANGVTSGSGTVDDPYIIESWDISAENAHGIWIRNTDAHFVIRNCVIENGRGVYYNGIYLYNVINGRVENCISENNYHGIYLHYSDNNTLINNICSKNYHGIYLHYSDNNTLDNNTCENNGWAGILLLNSPNNTLDNNTCKNNFAAGFFLWNSDNNTLHKNICENDYRGIWLDNSVHNTLTNNTCENNDLYGIYLQNSDNNCIYHNNFVNNETQAIDSCSNYWDNGHPSGGNYWSDYSGADADNDGIGDTPYSIPGGNNQDRYPLMNPFVPPEEALHAPTRWPLIAGIVGAVVMVSVATVFYVRKMRLKKVKKRRRRKRRRRPRK